MIGGREEGKGRPGQREGGMKINKETERNIQRERVRGRYRETNKDGERRGGEADRNQEGGRDIFAIAV